MNAGRGLAAALLALLLAGCGRDDRPSLILVVMDTTRADRLGCAGYLPATTPTLDSLATGGVRFAQAVTAVPVTAPSIATILSGVTPPVHGLRDNERFALGPDLTLLAQNLADAGYRTGAVVAAVPLLASFGFDRGFDAYDDRFAEDPYEIHDPALAGKQAELGASERRADRVTDRALAWLESAGRGRPVFLLAHYFDPHHPQDPPPDYAAAHPGRPYDGEIAFMDAQIGRLLAGARRVLGPDADLRVVAVGDHGEGLGEHGEQDHGFFVYDATMRVPLLMAGAGADPGRRVAAQVRTVDVAPTVLAWLGLPPNPQHRGRDLSGVLAGGPVPAACDTAYLETFLTQLHYDWSPLQGARTPASKWIRAPRPELYDLATDPGETVNLLPGAADDPRTARLRSWTERHLDGARAAAARLGPVDAGSDPELARRLHALGYASSGDRGRVVADWSLPDPKDGVRDWNRGQQRRYRLARARAALQAGDAAAAVVELEAAERLGPLRGRERALEGFALAATGRLEDAQRAFAEALAQEPEPAASARMRTDLAELLLEHGAREAARAQLDTLRAGALPPELAARVAGLAGRLESGE